MFNRNFIVAFLGSLSSLAIASSVNPVIALPDPVNILPTNEKRLNPDYFGIMSGKSLAFVGRSIYIDENGKAQATFNALDIKDYTGTEPLTDTELYDKNQYVPFIKKSEDISYLNITGNAIALGHKTTPNASTPPSVFINGNEGTMFLRNGITMDNARIHGVEDGVADTDAVNVRQLRRSEGWVKAGIAQALAAAGLPRATSPGKSMISASLGSYRRETGFAVGFSHVTEDNRKVLQINGSGDSQGYFGGSVGVGYQW